MRTRAVNGFVATACTAAFIGSASPTLAVEGGIGAYLLGTRDTLAGIVPPPGTYLSFSFDHLKGDVRGISLGGLPIRADAEVELNLVRLGFTTAFEETLWGGRPAFNLTLPIPDVHLRYTAITPPLAGRAIRDQTSGAGDLSITGILGWTQGNLHYNTALTVYLPTGSYSNASVDVGRRDVDALSLGKNVWSLQPVIAATYLNPQTGFEISGAASLLFSTMNDATDYQTAPALQFEGAIVQRLPSGWGLGVTGYHYEQIDDDSGRGAEVTRTAFGTDSLRARVSGLGPIVTFSGGRFLGGDLSLKLKYVREFNGLRRLESDVLSANVSLAF